MKVLIKFHMNGSKSASVFFRGPYKEDLFVRDMGKCKMLP